MSAAGLHYGDCDGEVGGGLCDSESPHHVEVDVSQAEAEADVLLEHRADEQQALRGKAVGRALRGLGDHGARREELRRAHQTLDLGQQRSRAAIDSAEEFISREE